MTDHPTRSPDSPDPLGQITSALLDGTDSDTGDVWLHRDDVKRLWLYLRAHSDPPRSSDSVRTPLGHGESCITATALGSGHERCQCLCHDEPDSVRTPDLDVLREALQQIESACTVFLTMAAKYHPDGGPAPAWLDFIRERQAEARAALHPASPPQEGQE
jgi:hypothetical protein